MFEKGLKRLKAVCIYLIRRGRSVWTSVQTFGAYLGDKNSFTGWSKVACSASRAAYGTDVIGRAIAGIQILNSNLCAPNARISRRKVLK